MAYVKNTWVDQDVERPKTYEVTNNQDGSITLTDSFGLVTELGTPVNEDNMNHIEDGIDGCAIRKHNLTETFNLGEWVLGGTGDDEGIYKSLIANNVGNAISDDTAWEKKLNLDDKADIDLSNITDAGKIAASVLGYTSNSKAKTYAVGASGTQYTAPATGSFWVQGQTLANYIAGARMNMSNQFGLRREKLATTANQLLSNDIEAKKGDVITLTYSGVNITGVTFVYAVGTESEAE